LNSYPQTNIESQQLTEQIKQIRINASIREIRFSIIFRILFTLIVYLLYVNLFLHLKEYVYLLLFSGVVISYVIIYSNIFLSKELYDKNIGYALSIIDILYVFISLWLGCGFFNKYVYLDSINIILIYVIIQTSLQGSYLQTLFSSLLVSTFSILFFSYFHPKMNTLNNAEVVVFHAFDTLSYAIYFLFAGIILSIKNYIRDESLKNVRDLIIKKIVTKAHLKLLSSNGEHLEGNWSISSEITHSEMLGADFISIRNNSNGTINVVIGDVTSHGLDVSPIAYACLSIFHAVQTDDPQIILTDMHKLVNKLGKKLSNGFLAMVFRLHPNGRIDYNGTLATPLECSRNNTIVELDTDGFIIGKNNINVPNVFKNKRVVLKNSNTLSIKTDGYYNPSSNDDTSFLLIKYLGKK